MNKRISLYELGLLANMKRCCILPVAVAMLLFLISGTHFLRPQRDFLFLHLLPGCSPVLFAFMAFGCSLSPTLSTVVTLLFGFSRYALLICWLVLFHRFVLPRTFIDGYDLTWGISAPLVIAASRFRRPLCKRERLQPENLLFYSRHDF